MLLRQSTTLPNTSLHSVSPMSGMIRHSATSGAKVISICKQPRGADCSAAHDLGPHCSVQDRRRFDLYQKIWDCQGRDSDPGTWRRGDVTWRVPVRSEERR